MHHRLVTRITDAIRKTRDHNCRRIAFQPRPVISENQHRLTIPTIIQGIIILILWGGLVFKPTQANQAGPGIKINGSSDIALQQIFPRCGLLAVQLPNVQIATAFWTLHFDVDLTSPLAMLNELTLILVKMDDKIPGNNPLSPRLAGLISTIPKAITRLQNILESVAEQTNDTKVVKAQYPISMGSVEQENVILSLLCTAYKAKCREFKASTDQTPLATLPSDAPEHIAAIELILHEIEAIQVGVLSDAELIQWSVTQLESWTQTTTTCDTTMTHYEEVFKAILRAHPSLLGRTIQLPCLSDRQTYYPFQMFTFPITIKDKLWEVPLRERTLLLFSSTLTTSDLISQDDLEPLYPNTDLPIYDGNGIARQPAPSYIAETMTHRTVAEPERCPVQRANISLRSATATLIAVARDAWIIFHYQPSPVVLTYRKGSQQYSINIPRGIHQLKVLTEILFQPSSKSFNVYQKLRKVAKAYYFQADSPEAEPDEPFENEVILTSINQDKDLFGLPITNNSWRETLAFTFAFIFLVICVLVVTFCCATQCKEFSSYLRTPHDPRLMAQKRTTVNIYDRPPFLDPCSPAVHNAVVPFLNRTNSSQW